MRISDWSSDVCSSDLHIDGTPAIRQITSRRLTDVTVHECWEGPCTVELRPNIQAPVYRLPVVEMLNAFYWRADFTLVRGEVLHDYLGSEERRVGKEGVNTCRYRGSRDH